MTIPRLKGMRQYWDTCPPTHISVYRLCRAYLEPAKDNTTAQPWNPEEPDELLSTIMG